MARGRIRQATHEPWWAYVYLAAIAAAAVGMLGAAAFNPDDGWLERSDALWRVFGVTAYVGGAAIYLLLLYGVARLIMWIPRRIRRAHSPDGPSSRL